MQVFLQVITNHVSIVLIPSIEVTKYAYCSGTKSQKTISPSYVALIMKPEDIVG
jgi:hypothetical protein